MDYLPDNPSITIDLKPFSAPMQTCWHNPRTGAQRAGEPIPHAGVTTLSRPAGWEDTLLVIRPQATAPGGAAS